jgi:hypothetical protein
MERLVEALTGQDRKGDWMQTYTGKVFWPMDPRSGDVCIEDIAHALSMQCRFAGHVREFYSVAEHSVRVSRLVERWTHSPLAWITALLHDASEAYLVDVPRPVKPFLKGYSEAERAVQSCIHVAFSLDLIDTPKWGSWRDIDKVIKQADNVLLATEARDLMVWPPPRDWHLSEKPLEGVIEPWSQEDAELRFLARFRALTQ